MQQFFIAYKSIKIDFTKNLSVRNIVDFPQCEKQDITELVCPVFWQMTSEVFIQVFKKPNCCSVGNLNFQHSVEKQKNSFSLKKKSFIKSIHYQLYYQKRCFHEIFLAKICESKFLQIPHCDKSVNHQKLFGNVIKKYKCPITTS